MALALLASGWARSRGGSILALTVDHGLRPESGAEAAMVGQWLEQAGMPSRILVWTGDKPKSGVQAAARDARLDLLISACRREAILHLLIAHQRDDQAETVAIRGAAGSGPVGLAGMAAVREVVGLRLLRPLLAVPKARLVATLAAAGRPWLVDPTNIAPRFARGRLRRDTAFAADGPWQESLARAAARQVEDRRIADWLALFARPHPLGFVRIDDAGFANLSPALRVNLLGRVLSAVGGRPYPVAMAKLRRAAEHPVERRITVGGCMIVRQGDELLICREPGGIRHRLELVSKGWSLWDGRFAISLEAGPFPVEIRALGAAGAAQLPDELRRRLRDSGVPNVIPPGLPAAWAEAVLVACPALKVLGLPARMGFSITAVLRPVSPLSPAAFSGVNVVSNPQPPIYRQVTGCEHGLGSVPGGRSGEASGSASRRAQ
jgi:tRNA(Ile)-lysidine synthase